MFKTKATAPTSTVIPVSPASGSARHHRARGFLIPEPSATVTPAEELVALLAEHGAQMFVGGLGEGVTGWAARVHGRITLIFPEGQDPAITLDVARTQIARLEADARPGPGHFPWCEPGACRANADSDGVTWTEHLGMRNAVPNRGAMPYHKGDLVDSVLAADPAFPEPALHVTWRGEGAPYSVGAARALAADLEVFLAGLKAQLAHLDATAPEDGSAK